MFKRTVNESMLQPISSKYLVKINKFLVELWATETHENMTWKGKLMVVI